MSDPVELPSIQAILESVPYSAAAILDAGGTYRAIGGALWSELGIDPRTMILGRRIPDLWEPAPAEALLELLGQAIEGRRASGVVPYQGRSYNVIVSPIAATRDAEDQAPLVLLLSRDVTEQEAGEQLFRDVVSAVPLGVAASDTEGVITVWNQAAADILGVPVEQAIGGSAEAMFDHLGLPEDAPVRAAILNAEAWEGEAEIVRGDERRLVHMIRTPSGEGRSSVAILQDVTDLRRAAAAEERERRLRSLGRVAGGVAHDFGNLLTAISGRVDLLLEQHEGAEFGSDLEEIRSALTLAEELTTRLLMIGDARVQPGRCAPAQVAARMEMLLRRLTPSNVAIELELGSTGEVGLGSSEIEQILLNLVTNSSDAMPKGGLVRVIVEDENEDVVVRVFDEGHGIGIEMLPTIFDPFVSGKSVGDGTGMGLSTVHGLVTAGGGTVEVERTGEEGTCIAIRLPRLAEEDGGAPAAEGDAVAALAEACGRLLLVEDEPLVRSLVARALGGAGCEVVAVEDVAEARRVLASDGAFDLVLSDVSLPGEDGITFAAELRRRFPGIPVVLMSGNFAQQIERHGAIPEGVRTLDKPFRIGELRSTLAAVRGAR